MSSPEPLEVAAEKYFALRRKLGYAPGSEREEVLLFARAMDARRRRKITLPLVIEWARSARNGSPKYAAWRYEAVRRFLTVAACTRRDTVVPPPGYLGRPFGRRRPHIYAGTEITALLSATRTLTPTAGLRPWTYRTLFGLLYATGLRVGEALALDRSDVDRACATLLVRRDKGRSSREIPLHPSVVEALGRYEARRDARHPAPRAAAFFLTETRGNAGPVSVRQQGVLQDPTRTGVEPAPAADRARPASLVRGPQVPRMDEGGEGHGRRDPRAQRVHGAQEAGEHVLVPVRCPRTAVPHHGPHRAVRRDAETARRDA